MRKRTGSIDKVGERFRVRITDNGQRSTLGIYDTEEEALRQRAAAIDVLTAETEPGDGETVGAWMEKHLAKREKAGVLKDCLKDRGRYGMHIAPHHIASISVKAVKPRHVDDLIEELRDKGLAPQSIINVVHLLSGAFNAGVRRGIMRSNPAWRAKVDRSGITHEPWTYATPEEQDRLIEAAGRHGNAVEFSIGTGLRAGELVTLRLADVHHAAVEPYIVVRFGGVPDQPTKGKRIRQVPLFGRGLAATLRQLRKIEGAPNRHGLLFPSERGGFRRANCIMRWSEWKAILERANLGRPFRWHDLRHTCASSLVSGWWGRSWTLVEVKGMLGHSAVSTTERYAHLSDTALKAAARQTATNWPRHHDAAKNSLEADMGKDSSVPSASRQGRVNSAPDSEAFQGLSKDARGRLLATARQLLEAASEGHADEALTLAGALSDAVLASPAVALALRVKDGGPLALTRALDLASLVVDASAGRKAVAS
jgi:integrase